MLPSVEEGAILGEEAQAVHLFGLLQPHNAAQRRGDVGQNAGPQFLAAKVPMDEVKGDGVEGVCRMRLACLRVHHGFNVAVVRRKRQNPAEFLTGFCNFSNARVHHAHSLEGGLPNPRMPHHVPVGEVNEGESVLLAFKAYKQLSRHLVGAHFRLQVIGLDVPWAGHQEALLSGEKGFASTIKEEGDVRIFFSFCGAVLAQARLGNQLRKNGEGRVGGKGGGQVREGFVILRHADILPKPQGAAVEFSKRGIGQGPSQLARPVRAEVEENGDVTVLHGGDRLPVVLGEDGGHNKLVRYIFSMALGNGRKCMGGFGAFGFDNGGEGFLHALPAFVPVHSPKAPTQGGYFPHPLLLHEGLQMGDKNMGALGGCVAPVGEGVHINFGEAHAFCGQQQGFEVLC